MEEGFRHESSQLRIKRRKEKMVEVQSVRIIQSTGRKDRHSKVCTAKGPRDRRVRLSAHTAIRFYDVQDRLGCDRPSKAIDWLMKEAKAAIDALDEMPTRNPCHTTMASLEQKTEEESTNLSCGFQNQQQMDGNIPTNTNSFRVLSSVELDNYPHSLTSRNRNQTEENSLCFQPLQENHLLHHQHNSLVPSVDFSSMPEMGWFQRMVTLNNPSSIPRNCKEPEGFVAYWQNQQLSQREPLQSIFSASIPEFNPPLVTGNVFGSDELAGFSVSSQIEEELSEQSSFLN